nr:hypothetical protein Iba_chr04cCG1670 [Ipomoea batatas]
MFHIESSPVESQFSGQQSSSRLEVVHSVLGATEISITKTINCLALTSRCPRLSAAANIYGVWQGILCDALESFFHVGAFLGRSLKENIPSLKKLVVMMGLPAIHMKDNVTYSPLAQTENYSIINIGISCHYRQVSKYKSLAAKKYKASPAHMQVNTH